MKRILFAAAIVIGATASSAQPMPQGQPMAQGKWWQRPEIVRELQLTPDQQKKLDGVFLGAADSLIDAKAEAEKMQVALRAELDRPQVRRAEVQRIVEKLNEARGRLFTREMMMLVDMRAVLAEEQWMKLRARLDERRGPGGAPQGRQGRPGRPGGRRP